MNKLPLAKRCQVVSALVEGCSIRSTVRMTGVAKNTVIKLLVDMGRACSVYQDRAMRNLSCQRLQIDEIWCFCYSKKKNVPEQLQGQFGYGDVWNFVAIDADTKLVPTWLCGERTEDDAISFVRDVAGRLSNRVQVTTDGHGIYLMTVPAGFSCEVDYAMLVKHYGSSGSARIQRPVIRLGSVAAPPRGSRVAILSRMTYRPALSNGKT
jgi:hypothetical protein